MPDGSLFRRPLAPGERLRKAWDVKCDWYDHSEIFHAPNASKAKGQAFDRLSEHYSDAGKIFASLRVRRAPWADITLPPRHPAADRICAKDLSVVQHAYGSDSRSPGYRDHFATHPGDMQLLRLAWEELLFSGPHASSVNGRAMDGTPDMAFFYLTALGKEVARSLLPTYPHAR